MKFLKTLFLYSLLSLTFVSSIQPLKGQQTPSQTQQEETSADKKHTCSICLGHVKEDGEKLKATECFDLFHPSCLKQWLQVKKDEGNPEVCPNCKRELEHRRVRNDAGEYVDEFYLKKTIANASRSRGPTSFFSTRTEIYL